MTEIMKGEAEAISKCEEICGRHPEYTEAEKTCILYGLYAGKACEVCGDRIKQKLDYNEFVKANSTLVGFKEKALRPLIREKDPEIQQKVISSVENTGKLKKAKFGTEKKMKAAISRAKGQPKCSYSSTCSTCGGETEKEEVETALDILKQFGAPQNVYDVVYNWIEEKYK